MPKRINADNVNVKGSVRRRKIIAAAVILCVFFLIEMYLAYNYLAYKAIANNYSSEIEALALSLFYLFRNFCLPLNFHTLTECFLCCMRVWYFNIGVLLILLLSVRRQDKYSGMENGSARWANKAELELVKSRSIMGEIPVAHGIGINPDNYNINNLNTVVVGAAGAGKSFGVMIPEIMSMFGSYIITDVKGDLYKWTAKLLSENGYKVRVFNLENLKFSNSFNPIVYCETDTDIDKLVNAFVLNSRREGASTGDSIWEDTLSMLLFALIRYVVDNPDEEKTFYRCLRLANSIEIVNGRIAPYCEWLKIMERLEAEEPDNSAVINWRNVCVAAPETLQSVVISLTSRLRLWANEDLRILTMTDEMDFDRLPEEKTAIFLIMPEGDSTFRSISSMFVSTAVERLKKIAKQKYNGRLPMLVSFELDEFANIGTLPNWAETVSTIRSQHIRAMMIIQDLQQMKKYKDADNTIINNCSIFTYLGTPDTETNKKISEKLGNTTIYENRTSRNTGTRGGGGSVSENSKKRELMTAEEVSHKDKNKCIVFIDELHALYVDKFHTKQHPLFNKLGIADPKHPHFKNNTFVEKEYAQLYEQHREEYLKYRRQQAEEIPDIFSDLENEWRKRDLSESDVDQSEEALIKDAENTQSDSETIEREFLQRLKNINN